jgi:hypothetical protein
MKTMATTEEVSSHPAEKGHRSPKRHWNIPSAYESPKLDWEKGLQICESGEESQKRPTPVVGQKPYGKCQFNCQDGKTTYILKEGHECSAEVAIKILVSFRNGTQDWKTLTVWREVPTNQ